MMNEITLLITSYDQFFKYWHNFHILLERYFKADMERVFVSNSIPMPYEGYKNILAGDAQFGTCLIKALKSIDTKYVFHLMADYYLDTTIDAEFIKNNIFLLEKYNASKIVIDQTSRLYRLTQLGDALYKFNRSSAYVNTLQPAVWDREFMLSVTNESCNPWQFEVKYNYLAARSGKTVLLNTQYGNIYFNFVNKGKLSKGYDYFLSREKLFHSEG